MADPENGLVQQTDTKRLNIVMQYLPSVYQVWQDIRFGAAYTVAQADSVKKQYDAFYYFRLLIRSNSLKGKHSNYFNYGIRKELSLIRAKDTIPCSICERIVNGNTSLKEYLIAFPRSKNELGNGRFKTSLNILYTGKFLEVTPHIFRFSKAKLNKIPRLKL